MAVRWIAVWLLGLAWGLSATATMGVAAELTPDQKRELRTLLTRFRAAASAEDRNLLAEEVLRFGRPAAEQLSTLVGTLFRSELPRYSELFQEEAARVAQAQARDLDLTHVQHLRDKVLSLRKHPTLTKEMIVEQGDPAIAELHKILTVTREQVLEQSDKARTLRQTVLTLEGCAVSIALDYPDIATAVATDEQGRPAPLERLLGRGETAAVRRVVLADAKTRMTLAANARTARDIDPEEAAAIACCNHYRVLAGLSALEIDLRLCAASRDHSKDMETEKFFSHSSPIEGKHRFSDRAKLMGTTASAENIYSGSVKGTIAQKSWWHSPGHHRNMMGDHQRIGVGRSGRLFTQMFGR